MQLYAISDARPLQIHGHALKMLGRKNQSLADIVKTLRIYHDNINDVSGTVADMRDSAPPLKEILQNLINALDMTDTQ